MDAKRLLQSGFKKCGIYSLNRQEVLDRIPSSADTQKISKDIDAVLLKRLVVRRFGDGKKKPRGKKSLLASLTQLKTAKMRRVRRRRRSVTGWPDL